MTFFSTYEWKKNREAARVALARYKPCEKKTKTKLNEYEIYFILGCYTSIEQNYEVLFISLGGLGNY